MRVGRSGSIMDGMVDLVSSPELVADRAVTVVVEVGEPFEVGVAVMEEEVEAVKDCSIISAQSALDTLKTDAQRTIREFTGSTVLLATPSNY